MLKAEDTGRALEDRSSGAKPPAMPGPGPGPGRWPPKRGGPLSMGYGVTVAGRSYGAGAVAAAINGGLSDRGYGVVAALRSGSREFTDAEATDEASDP